MMKLYKLVSLTGAVVFAAVGLVFLFLPAKVLIFFNTFSDYLGLPQAPVQDSGFYLILAVAYMYLVTLLAYLMYRYPEDRRFPFLLAHAKLASAAISLYFFLTHRPYLIYITNCLVDLSIGLAVMLCLQKLKPKQ